MSLIFIIPATIALASSFIHSAFRKARVFATLHIGSYETERLQLLTYRIFLQTTRVSLSITAAIEKQTNIPAIRL